MRKLSFIFVLVIALSLSAYTGGYHHFCTCHSQECSICTQDAVQYFVLSERPSYDSDAAYDGAASFVVLSEEIIPDTPLCLTSLKDRAPPRHGVIQAVAPCHRDMRAVGA